MRAAQLHQLSHHHTGPSCSGSLARSAVPRGRRAQRAGWCAPVHVASPAKVEDQPLSSSIIPDSVPHLVSIDDIRRPVAEDMETLTTNLKNCVPTASPVLMAAAEQIFGAGGKKIRPMLVLLVARATAELAGLSDITKRHRRLAEITEMIHTASLVHDDVLDDCSVRRGAKTVNSLYGTRVAVLAGDYLFAQSSWGLAQLDNLEVIKLISQVIADFADGEIKQATCLFDTELTIEDYMEKSFFKTASLIAASCRSAAVLSECSEEAKEAMFAYGKHLGLAFQVVDDILDYTQTSEQLGKPRYQDLATGNLTAPALFALPAAPELADLVETEFLDDGALDRAIELVEGADGYGKARALAKQEGRKALDALEVLPDCPARYSLQLMVDYVLHRVY